MARWLEKVVGVIPLILLSSTGRRPAAGHHAHGHHGVPDRRDPGPGPAAGHHGGRGERRGGRPWTPWGWRRRPRWKRCCGRSPRVHVRTNSRGEAEISVRGSESRQVAVLMDGVPLTLGWDARTDVSVLPAGRGPRDQPGARAVVHPPRAQRPGGGGGDERGPGDALPRRRRRWTSGGYDGVGGTAPRRPWPVPFRDLRRPVAGPGGRRVAGLARCAPPPSGVSEPVPTADALRLNTDYNSVDGFFAFRYARDAGGWLSLSASTFQAERGIAGELGADEPRLWRYPDIRRTIVATSVGTGDRTTPLGRGDLEASVGMDLGHSRDPVLRDAGLRPGHRHRGRRRPHHDACASWGTTPWAPEVTCARRSPGRTSATTPRWTER